MNTAWISGTAGYAIVAEDAQGKLSHLRLDAGRKTPPVPCSAGQLRHLLSTAPDIESIRDPGPPPFDRVRVALDNAWRQDRALALGLTAVDAEMPDDLRVRAARQANGLLVDEGIRTAVRNRLLGTPLPEVADLSRLPQGSTISALFSEAHAARDRVKLARRAWRLAYQVLFCLEEGPDPRFLEEVVNPACIMRGGYAVLVEAARVGQRAAFDEWLHLHDREAPFDQPGVLAFLEEWGRTTLGSAKSRYKKSQLLLARLERTRALRRRIEDMGFKIADLKLSIVGGKVTLTGKVDDQRASEMLALVVGNFEDVEVVDNQLEVANLEPRATFYTVVRGDTLSKIAKKYYGNANKHPAIFEANKPILKHPGKIYPGQVLRIPSLAEAQASRQDLSEPNPPKPVSRRIGITE